MTIIILVTIVAVVVIMVIVIVKWIAIVLKKPIMIMFIYTIRILVN
jgi:hypothetical protein